MAARKRTPMTPAMPEIGQPNATMSVMADQTRMPTGGMTQGPSGGREATPAEAAAALEYSRSRVAAGTTQRRRTTTTPTPPAQQIDWQALATAIEAQWDQAARELYGGYFAIIDKYPELKDFLRRAVQEKWTDQKFLAELTKTKYYNETVPAARAWDADIDIAGKQEKVRQQSQDVRKAAVNLGITLTDAQIQNLSETSLRLGYNEQDLRNAIIAEGKRTGVSNLTRSFVGQSVRQGALDYGIRLSDASLEDWTNKIASGEETTTSFDDYLRNTAKALFPSLSNGFDRGLSFKVMTDPYAESAARILGVNPAEVDFTDPKWAQAFTSRDPKGEQRMMSIGEWNDYLRSTPAFGYEYTDEARTRAYTVVNRLAELFGQA